MRLVGLELDPKMQIGSCSVAQKQLIELAKVISDNVKVLIMDEPTSALNDVETEHLFQFIHMLLLIFCGTSGKMRTARLCFRN